MFDKEKLGLERAFATEVTKIFAMPRPKLLVPEVLYKKAELLRHLADEPRWRSLTLAQEIRKANIDQLKTLCRVGAEIWDRERARGRGWDVDPLHLLKLALRTAARTQADKIVFGRMVEKVI